MHEIDDVSSNDGSEGELYIPYSALSNASHLVSQGDLNDLVQDRNLTNGQGELLLQKWNILDQAANVKVCRKQRDTLVSFFSD